MVSHLEAACYCTSRCACFLVVFFSVIFVLIIPFILQHLLFLTINDVDDGDE